MDQQKMYKLNIGDRAIDFSLEGVDGKTLSLAHFRNQVLVLFFTCNHCPYVKAYEDRIIALAKKYAGKADFVAINSNDAKNYPEDSFNNMVKRAKEKEFPFPYLYDESQDVARVYGGNCTPHFLVFDKKRMLQYQGRLDDNWQNAHNVIHHDLRDAIEALLAGKKVENPETRAVGCSIKWMH